jgi:hypothetical protein
MKKAFEPMRFNDHPARIIMPSAAATQLDLA